MLYQVSERDPCALSLSHVALFRKASVGHGFKRDSLVVDTGVAAAAERQAGPGIGRLSPDSRVAERGTFLLRHTSSF